MAQISHETLDRFLRKVQKPIRYTGGEWNMVVKDWRTTDLKVAISYPDTYEHPLVIGGGSGADNPECMSDFVDLFVIGEGEETLMELLDLFAETVFTGEHDADGKPRKREGWRAEYLARAAKLTGVYVPSLYEPQYNDDGTFADLERLHPNAQPFIPKKKV